MDFLDVAAGTKTIPAAVRMGVLLEIEMTAMGWLPDIVPVMRIQFTVPGNPQAKQRVRAVPLKRCLQCGKTTMRHQCLCGSYNMSFITNVANTPKETVNYENLVKLCASEALQGQQFAGGVKLRADFYFQIPVSRAKKLREGDRHVQRPDADNCLKSVLDGMNKVAWSDDSLVCEVAAGKFWTTGVPRCEVVVEECI
jgi:Holliday junction resolvase RusA-like endonuclease